MIQSIIKKNALLRPIEKNDLALILEWRNHPSVMNFMYTNRPITMSEHLSWYEKSIANELLKLRLYVEDGKEKGFVQFKLDLNKKIAKWGFYVCPNAAKGTGLSLGKASLDFAFKELNLHKVIGESLILNQKSINFHKKLGFQTEGLLRDNYFNNCCYIDVMCFGLLDSEWENHAKSLP